MDFTIGFVEDLVLPLVANPAVVGYSEADVNFAVFLTVFTAATWLALLATSLLSAAAYLLLIRRFWAVGAAVATTVKVLVAGWYYFFLSLLQVKQLIKVVGYPYM